ncbi:hypothetical protein BCR36DRAFT_374783 [Piromyces finnis]|uniref:Uncharacterized protein n=1 Tax=Piromyces finnis TaxID=1754191 RepID=A0A1Y1UVL2_9FUNG|nr:hypothetical protein BCR36DRAFT_374783 [Piromyces finnis]|eukprot:ORX42020.1 hypothetical protein BCR36DRAFT_374783 [Piromyces finnis]
MQSLQPVRERKINKAHREYITSDNTMDMLNDKISIAVSIDKKKSNHTNNVERKRKRISAKNEILIPKLDEKYKISSNSSQHKKMNNNEMTENSMVVKPKKYYDQDEIRKYMKEKRLSRKKSKEELDQVVPEKPKPKSYNVNEVRDFMRKRLKAREEQHKKELQEKEKKSNDIKQRLERLREFQRKQINNNTNNKINSTSAEKINKSMRKEPPQIQRDNYLKSSMTKDNTIIIKNFQNNQNENDRSISADSASLYDNSMNTYSFINSSEYETIQAKMKNSSSFVDENELSTMLTANSTNIDSTKNDNMDMDNTVTSSSNYSEDYSIESLQYQAKRIQELIKNAEFLAQRIEQHTSKMPKPKENSIKISNLTSSEVHDRLTQMKSYSHSIHSVSDPSPSSSTSSPSSSSNHNPIALSSYHSPNMTSNYIEEEVPSIHENVSYPFSSPTHHEMPKAYQTPILESSKGKNEYYLTNNYSQFSNKALSHHPSIDDPMTQHYAQSLSSSSAIPLKNKLKEKDPYYSTEESIYNNTSATSPIPQEEDSWTKDKHHIERHSNFTLSSDSEIKLENLENITPSQWKVEINSPAKTGDNYSTINIFTRRFQPTRKEDIKKKSDSGSIYKKIVEKMEENQPQDHQTLSLYDDDQLNGVSSTERNDVTRTSENFSYDESDHSSSHFVDQHHYSDTFTNLSNYNSTDDSSHSSEYYSSTMDNNQQQPTPLPLPPQPTNYEHFYMPPLPPQSHQYYPPPQPQVASMHPLLSSTANEPKEVEGRLSPHSLSRKLMSEINYLETLNESNMQLEKMKNERNTVRTEQEMSNVLQALILKQRKHEMDIENANKFREEHLRTIGVQAIPEEQLRCIGVQAIPEDQLRCIGIQAVPEDQLRTIGVQALPETYEKSTLVKEQRNNTKHQSISTDLYEDSFEDLTDKDKSIHYSSESMTIPSLLNHHDQTIEKDSQLISNLDDSNSSSSLQMKESISKFRRNNFSSYSSAKDSDIEEEIPIQENSTSTIKESLPSKSSDKSISHELSIQEEIPEDVSHSKSKSSIDAISEDIPVTYSNSQNKEVTEESIIEEEINLSIKNQDSSNSNMVISPRYSSPKSIKSEEDLRRISRYLEKEKYPKSRSPSPSQHSINQYYQSMDSFESYQEQKDDPKETHDNHDFTSSSSLMSINEKIEQLKSKLLDDHLEKKEYRLSLSKEIAENLLKKRQKAIKWEEKLKKEEKEIKDILNKALNMQAKSPTVSSASSSYTLSNENDYLDSHYRAKEESKRKNHYVNSPLSNIPLKAEPEEMTSEMEIEENLDKNKNSSMDDYMEDDEAEDEEIIEENYDNHQSSSSFDKYKEEKEDIEERIEQSSAPTIKSDSIMEEIVSEKNTHSNTKSLAESIKESIDSNPSAINYYNSNSFESDVTAESIINNSMSHSRIKINPPRENSTKSKQESKRSTYSEILENDLKSFSISSSLISNEEDLDEEENKLKERIHLLKIQIDKQKNVAKQLFLEKKKQRQLIHQKLLEKEMHFRKQLDRINSIVKKTEDELNDIMKGGSVVSSPDVSILQEEQDQSVSESYSKMTGKYHYSSSQKTDSILNFALQYNYSDSFESERNSASLLTPKKSEKEYSSSFSSYKKEDLQEDHSMNITEESKKSMASEIPMEKIEKDSQSLIQIEEGRNSFVVEEDIEEDIPSEMEESRKEESIKDESEKEKDSFIVEKNIEENKSLQDESLKEEEKDSMIVEEKIEKVISSEIEESIKEESKKDSIIIEKSMEESIPSEMEENKRKQDESLKEEEKDSMVVEEEIEEAIPSEIEESIKEESKKDSIIIEKSMEESIPSEMEENKRKQDESLKEEEKDSMVVEEEIEEAIPSEIEESIKEESRKEENVNDESIKEGDSVIVEEGEEIEEAIPSEIEESIKDENISPNEEAEIKKENKSELDESIQSEFQIVEKKESIKEISEQKYSIPSEVSVEENIEESFPSEIQMKDIQDISESSHSETKSSITEKQNSKMEDEIQSDIEMVDTNMVENTKSSISEVQPSLKEEDMQYYSDDFVELETSKLSSQIQQSQIEKDQTLSEKPSSILNENEKEYEKSTNIESISEEIEEEVEENIEEEIMKTIESSVVEEKSSIKEPEIINSMKEGSSASVVSNEIKEEDVENKYADDTFIDEDQMKSTILSSSAENEKEESVSEEIDEEIEEESFENEEMSIKTSTEKEEENMSIKSSTEKEDISMKSLTEKEEEDISIKSLTEKVEEEEVIDEEVSKSISERIENSSEKIISEISEESSIKNEEVDSEVSKESSIKNEEVDSEESKESLVKNEEIDSELSKESLVKNEEVDSEESKESLVKNKEIGQESIIKEISQEKPTELSEKENSILEEEIEEEINTSEEKESVSIIDINDNNDIEDALAILQEASDIIKKDWTNTKEIQVEKENENEKQEIISNVTQQIFNDLLTDTMNVVNEITELKNNQQILLNEELIAQPVDETTENDIETDIAVNDITDSMMEGLIEEILKDVKLKEKLDNDSIENRLLQSNNIKSQNSFSSKVFERINNETVNRIAASFLEKIPEAEYIEPPFISASTLCMFDEYPLDFDERMRIRIVFDMVNEAITDIFKKAEYANNSNNWLRTKQALPPRALSTKDIKIKVLDLLNKWTNDREKFNFEPQPVLEVQLKEEENLFVDYDDRNIQIQNQVTEMIWNDLLEDSVHWLNKMEETKSK